jgi:arylsulfatase A-like enzyme
MILEDGTEGTQADVLAADQAIAILENRAQPRPEGAINRTKLKENAPFFLAVGFVRPHVPFIAPERHFAPYPDSSMNLPLVPPSDLEDVPDQAARMANERFFRMTTEEQRKAIAGYHASVRFMDEQVGRLLDTLERLEIDDNTMMLFLSDHGFNLGEHTAWQKTSLWEESVRVPLIASGPGIEAGSRSDAVVELVDLYPTIAGLAGVSVPEIVQGQSLVPVLNGRSIESGAAYTITLDDGASLRTDRWRYNRWGESADGSNEELYDHVSDPGEFTNLARDPRYADELDAMRRAFEEARGRARQ